MTAEEANAPVAAESDETEDVVRVYEIGYHIIPTVKEEDIEKIVSGVRAVIEKHGGNFIAEGAPDLTRLAYPMQVLTDGKKVDHDRGYFGWIKFEAKISVAEALEDALRGDADFLRFIVFRTAREDTRAKMRPPTLREVKRTDTIKSSPRRAEESSAPVSEEDLEKALQDLTAE
ncbi:MAG: 30S ribosomal protein S6 [Patescibacteria group bacterium]|nr:30S ribosomal protein S6 [bacterium]MDZ4227390.1 30S ribosomal protein S6 [Patescibacteria group bacterium]